MKKKTEEDDSTFSLYQKKRKENEVIKNLSSDVDTLKNDMKDIKELLFRLVEDKK